jgi:hypothetical protein
MVRGEACVSRDGAQDNMSPTRAYCMRWPSADTYVPAAKTTQGELKQLQQHWNATSLCRAPHSPEQGMLGEHGRYRAHGRDRLWVKGVCQGARMNLHLTDSFTILKSPCVCPHFPLANDRNGLTARARQCRLPGSLSF